MKYKVILGGRGAEVWVHKLNEQQKQQLTEGNVEDGEMESIDIEKLLEIDCLDQSDEVYTGAYIQNTSFVIDVYNESNEIVWDSTSNPEWDFDDELMMEYDNYSSVADAENVLIVEDYQKGNYYEYILDIEEEFDPNKITPVITEIGDRFELITGICYNGIVMEIEEYGDTWSKGLSFYLN